MNRLVHIVSALILICAELYAGIPTETPDDNTRELMRFAGNIHQFNSIYPQEKVYLQFDNTSYYPGETIWFKAFVVNASTLKRSESKVLYVDLLSPDGVLLKQQKLMIVAGQADGSFPLIETSTAQARELRGVTSYPSGFYEIRAYTNYMQNFGNETFFSRVLAVFDKPKQEGHYYDEQPKITLKYSNTSPIRPETPKQKKVNLSFYPEGGHIIIGQPCRVAFKVTGDNGLGISATGSLGNDITFSTLHDGMGSFVFTPRSKHSSVNITVDGHQSSYNLPDAEQSGCTVQATLQEDEKIRFTIYSSADIINQELGMTLTCRGELVDFTAKVISGNETDHIFDLASTPEGVIRFTLFNKTGYILATRSFYHERSDATIPSINVTASKRSYAPFEKITLDFQLTDGTNIPFRDRFCLSVRDSRSPVSICNDDLRTNLLLSSDLKGFIEKPDYYFNSANQDRKSNLDLLCMIQGWERYDWQTMTGIDKFQETFRLEDKGLSLNGWILKSTGRKPQPNVEVDAALIPEDKRLTETYRYDTDSTGYFGFDIGVPFYDKARFSINATPHGRRLRKSAIIIVFDRSKAPIIRPYQPGETQFVNKVITSMPQDMDSTYESYDLISVDKGIILPDVDIEEKRKYIDYYTFQALDVVKDVEKELDKGNFSTDLFGYLTEHGFNVEIGFDPDSLSAMMKRMEREKKGPIRFDFKLLLNGRYAYTYVHTESLFRDLEKESRIMGDDNDNRDDPSILASTIDTRDIKSIMVYDLPMSQSEAWDLSPLYTKGSLTSYWDHMRNVDDAALSKIVYMVDVLLKNTNEISPKNEQYDRSKRYTTVDGYSRPYSFYSPEYPNGPIPGDVDYRRTIYWNPNIITDEDGKAQVEFYNNSITEHFDISAAGITASGIPYILNQTW